MGEVVDDELGLYLRGFVPSRLASMLGISVRRPAGLGFPGLGGATTYTDTNDCYRINYDPAQPGGFLPGAQWNAPENIAAAQREFDLMHTFTAQLPPCSGQDCSSSEWNELPLEANAWYMPAGAVKLPYGVWFTLDDFKGVDVKADNVEVRKTMPGNTLSAAVKNALLEAVKSRSAEQFLKTAGNNPTGSVQLFLDRNPGFASSYKGITWTTPKYAEMTGGTGLRDFIANGRYLLEKKALDGEVVLCQFPLRACGAWCKGCKTKNWPDGILTCAIPVAIDQERHWNMRVAFNEDGSFTFILRRQPDQRGWLEKYVGAPHVWLLENTVGLLFKTICKVHEKPETQVAAATAASMAPPPYAAAIVAVKVGLDAMCPFINAAPPPLPTIMQPELPTVPTPPPTPPVVIPPPPEPPWYSTTGGITGLAVGGGLAAGLLIFAVKRSRR